MLSISMAATAHQTGEGRRRRFSIIPDKLSRDGNGLVRNRRQRLAQQIALIRKGGDAPGHVGVVFQIGGDFRLSLGFQNAIHIGVEIVFRDGPIAHFMLRNCTTFFGAPSAVPSISCCNFSRARDRRDMTVPMGMSSTLAASA